MQQNTRLHGDSLTATSGPGCRGYVTLAYLHLPCALEVRGESECRIVTHFMKGAFASAQSYD